jgi:hypothetical protein
MNKLIYILLIFCSVANAEHYIKINWEQCLPTCEVRVADNVKVQEFIGITPPFVVPVVEGCYRVDICSPYHEFDNYEEQLAYNKQRCKWTKRLSTTTGQLCVNGR